MAENARLLLQVDAAVELARSNLRALAATMDTESKNYDRSVQRIEASHKRIETSMGGARSSMMEMQHVFRSMGDSVAAGQDPMRAFSMEIGRVAEAATMAGGSLGAVGKVLGGPWGLALTAGVGLLATFGGELFKAGNSLDEHVKKLKEAADNTKLDDQAKAAWERTTEGAIEALKKETAEIEKQNKSLRDNVTEQERRIQKNKLNLQLQYGDTQIKIATTGVALTEARKNFASARDPSDPNYAAAKAEVQATLAALQSLRAQSVVLQAGIDQADKNSRAALAPLLDKHSERHTDKSAAITGVFEDALDVLHKKFTDGKITIEQYVQQEDNLRRTRDAGLEGLKKRRVAKPHFGRDIAEANNADLLTTAQTFTGARENTAKGKATLETLFDEANIHIDPAKVAWCAAFVNSVLAVNHLPGTGSLAARSFQTYGTDSTRNPEKGDIVTLRLRGSGEVNHVGFFAGFDSKGNVRVTGGNQGNRVSTETFGASSVASIRRAPTADQAAKMAETAAIRAAVNDRAYQAQLGQAQDRLARAQLSLSDTAEGRLEIELDELRAASRQRSLEIDDQVTAGKISNAQADKLKSIDDETEFLQEIRATQAKRQTILDQQLHRDQAELGSQLSILNLEEGLAQTRKERLRIALLILAKEEEELRDAANRKLQSNDRNIRAEGAQDLRRVDAEHPFKVAAINQRNADPLTSYMQQLRANAGDMNEALKGVEVDGLRSLEDGILGLINGTESVAGAFKKMATSIIADLARIAIEKSILSLLGGGGGGGNPLSALLGGTGGMSDAGSLFSGLGFAAGGSPPVGKLSVVGENGPELFLPKTPGVIIPNHMLGGKSGGGIAFNIQIDAKGAEIGVEQKIATAIVEAAPHIIKAAHRQTMGSLTRRGING